MREVLAILLLAIGYVAVEIIVGTAIGLILGAIMERRAERDLRRDYLPGRMVTFPAMENHRRFLAGEITAEEYGRADPTPIVEPLRRGSP